MRALFSSRRNIQPVFMVLWVYTIFFKSTPIQKRKRQQNSNPTHALVKISQTWLQYRTAGSVQRVIDSEREWERDAKTMRSNGTRAEHFFHHVYKQKTNAENMLNFGSCGLSRDDIIKHTQSTSSRGF